MVLLQRRMEAAHRHAQVGVGQLHRLHHLLLQRLGHQSLLRGSRGGTRAACRGG